MSTSTMTALSQPHDQIQHWAEVLDDAARYARETPQFDSDKTLSLSDAYAIQAASIARRLSRGETRVGMKMGFTSRAKMIQMGLSDVIWGRLTSSMQIEDGGIAGQVFIHARAEPELAFVMKRELAGNVTPAQALAAVEAIAPAIEVIDSRYRDFKFTLPEVIADNASSSGFVLGSWASPATPFDNLGLIMSINGRPAQIGSTAALLGHPLRSLVAAARIAAENDEPLQPGWIVMAGGATPAEWIHPGDHVAIEMQSIGRAGFQLKEIQHG